MGGGQTLDPVSSVLASDLSFTKSTLRGEEDETEDPEPLKSLPTVCKFPASRNFLLPGLSVFIKSPSA